MTSLSLSFSSSQLLSSCQSSTRNFLLTLLKLALNAVVSSRDPSQIIPTIICSATVNMINLQLIRRLALNETQSNQPVHIETSRVVTNVLVAIGVKHRNNNHVVVIVYSTITIYVIKVVVHNHLHKIC